MKEAKVDPFSVDKVLEGLPEERRRSLQRKLSNQFIRRSESTSSPSPKSIGARKPKSLGETHLKMYRQASFADDPETRPKSMEHAIRWFKEHEKPKGVGMDLDGTISFWFHGTI